ncbi:competence protein ComEA [Cryobacterium mesophilum]|uniref:Competence protein ComEA n=1 Tax=Terrimesophilobacter mesophilus TaxID=433647 RepID=A0A4R8V8G3_9MICO|nr:helix-hairpin-helix domain-containing protein [Terrimesophilobacter mesophilus]MBB5632269.1 competence protein ComEA [Terrimesophilobacter mesophilus]TFB79119.1 competence protein ComEA [Terrimesophilobacter mesophilus]
MPSDPLAASRSGRLRVGLGAAVVLLIVGVGVAVLVSAFSASGSRTLVDAPRPSASSGEVVTGPSAELYVHILGAVQHPGLYRFTEGDRAIDAIAAAGGYTRDADRTQLNLARFLSDGEQIYIPTEKESAARGTGGTPGAPGAPGATVGGKVNINTADAASLETLPRVGPALAARILAWREANGRFTSIEDLMSVSGIGDKTFAGLKDLVTI